MVLGIPFSGTVIKLGLAGVVIAGVAIAADKLNLGTAIAEGANEVGKAGGSVITQPIAGLTETLTAGINDIRLRAQELFEGFGVAGADFQEAFTGNRNAIGDFFDGDDFLFSFTIWMTTCISLIISLLYPETMRQLRTLTPFYSSSY